MWAYDEPDNCQHHMPVCLQTLHISKPQDESKHSAHVYLRPC